MKRVQLAASRLMAKSKDAALSPEASATIVQVLKIASTINVPFCQTACNAIIAFIQMGEAAGTNDRQWRMLLDAIKIYAGRISEFVEAISEGHPSDYFAVSDDLRAKIAREAVEAFEKHISETKSKIEARLGTGKVKKRLGATVIQEEITECRLMIATAHEQFNGRILNILAISSAGVPVPSRPSAPEETEYDIPGARPLRGQDIEILEELEIAAIVPGSFWTNIVRVEVHNKVRIAKIYDPSDGGKEKFEKDLQFFTKCWSPKMIRIFGYSSRSQFPFVVFTAASVLPLASFWVAILLGVVGDPATSGTYFSDFVSLSTQMELVTQYLFRLVDRQNVDHLLQIRTALRGSTVDSNGKLIVAPLTQNSIRKNNMKLGCRYASKYAQLYPSRKRRSLNLSMSLPYRDQVIQTWPVGKGALACLYQRWPDEHFSRRIVQTVTVGDLIAFPSRDPSSPFDIIANATAFTGPIRFYPPGEPTSQMHVYRCKSYDHRGERRRSRMPLQFSWFCDADSNCIELDDLWRFLVHKRIEVPACTYGGARMRRSDFALVTVVQYFVEAEESPIVSPSDFSGPSPNLYMYFSPQNEYIAARWSFYPEPPTEAQAAEEASLLSSFPCPTFSSEPKTWMMEYLHFEGV